MKPYTDRAEAGQTLADRLHDLADRADVTAVGLPRGGVPVAAEVARTLGVSLDVLVVRKLGVPGHEELAMGAVAGGGASVLNEELISQLAIPEQALRQVAERERQELEHRDEAYRGGRAPLTLTGRIAILIDDGIATGATMRAAVQLARQLGAREVVVAVPVAPPATIAALERAADRVVCPLAPDNFRAVGQWYQDFAQVSDEDVQRILANAAPSRQEGQG